MLSVLMLGVTFHMVMLSVTFHIVMLSVLKLNIILLRVVEPICFDCVLNLLKPVIRCFLYQKNLKLSNLR